MNNRPAEHKYKLETFSQALCMLYIRAALCEIHPPDIATGT
jgi:hypothetical protein